MNLTTLCLLGILVTQPDPASHEAKEPTLDKSLDELRWMIGSWEPEACCLAKRERGFCTPSQDFYEGYYLTICLFEPVIVAGAPVVPPPAAAGLLFFLA